METDRSDKRMGNDRCQKCNRYLAHTLSPSLSLSLTHTHTHTHIKTCSKSAMAFRNDSMGDSWGDKVRGWRIS